MINYYFLKTDLICSFKSDWILLFYVQNIYLIKCTYYEFCYVLETLKTILNWLFFTTFWILHIKSKLFNGLLF